MRQLADALTSADPAAAAALVETSRQHAGVRFQEEYDLWELIIEYRLLRRIILEEVEPALPSGRSLSLLEQITLHMGIDAMLQRGIMAFVEHQQDRLRAATEAESKYLSFFSHDLRNNINSMTLTLEMIKSRRAGMAGMEEEVADLDAVQAVGVHDDRRHGSAAADSATAATAPGSVAAVDLHELAAKVAQQFTAQAQQKGLRLVVEVPPERGSTVTASGSGSCCRTWSAMPSSQFQGDDSGSGRAPSHRQRDGCCPSRMRGRGSLPIKLQRLFEAFQRGDTHGQAGVGLGLAIASQAAKLLGGPLTVESQVGVGSTFRLVLPDLRTLTPGASSWNGLPAS